MKYKKLVIASITIITIIVLICVMAVMSNKSNKIKHRSQWYLDKIFSCSDTYYKELIGDRKVKIAVIDSGLYTNHNDLQNSNIEMYSVSQVNEKINTDWEHGTMVAGIICSQGNLPSSLLGINPSASILMIDISDNQGISDIVGIIEAIDYAIDKGADIINISFTTKTDYVDLHEAINRALEKNIIIVASAGNDIDGKITYPAAYDNVISVGAYAKNGDILYSELENTVYLPGENIVSLYGDKVFGSKYISKSGTSLAAPILSGLISIILSRNEYTNTYIYEKLMSIKKIDTIYQLINNIEEKEN